MIVSIHVTIPFDSETDYISIECFFIEPMIRQRSHHQFSPSSLGAHRDRSRCMKKNFSLVIKDPDVAGGTRISTDDMELKGWPMLHLNNVELSAWNE